MNKGLIFFNLFFCLFLFTSNAQIGNFEWVKVLESSSLAAFNSAPWVVHADDNGNVYSAGSFSGTLDFDPGSTTHNLTASGYTDMYIQKLDPNGDFLWALNFGSTYFDVILAERIYDLKTDQIGNVYFVASFAETVDFDPGLSVSSVTCTDYNSDFVLCKLDQLGNLVWVEKLGDTFYDEGLGIDIDDNSNIYITGYHTDSTDFEFGLGTTSLGNNGSAEDAFIVKYDEHGALIWAKNIGGTSGIQRSFDVKVDDSGNVFIVGDFYNTTDFDPGSGVFNMVEYGSSDGFLCKLDSNGDFVYAKQFGEGPSSRAHDVAISSADNVLVAGFFSDSIDADPGLTSSKMIASGNRSSFLSQLDANGNFIWSKHFDSHAQVDIYGIAYDFYDYVYVSGRFVTDMIIDAHTFTTNGGNQVGFISKFDNLGNYITTELIDGTTSGTHQEIVSSVDVSSDNNVYVTGWFKGTADFDFSSNTHNESSLTNAFTHFVLKMSPTNIIEIDTVACSSYTTPSGNAQYYVSGQYFDTINFMNNLDTVYKINLNFSPIIYDTIDITACYSYTSPSGNYIWTSSDTYQDTIAGYCPIDTIYTINLTVNHIYYDTLNPFVCNTTYTSPSGQIYTTSGTYSDTIAGFCDIDTIYTINLDVSNIDVSVSQNGASLIAGEPNASYQWLDCETSYSEITNENSQVFYPQNQGFYAVEISSLGCIDTSQCILIDDLGIDLTLSDFDNIAVYYNPNLKQIEISRAEHHLGEDFYVYNIAGQLVFKGQINNTKQIINQEFNSGTYIIKLESGTVKKMAVISSK